MRKNAGLILAVGLCVFGSVIYLLVTRIKPVAPQPINGNDLVETSREGSVIMKIESPQFQNDQTVPVLYTCEGSDFNPPLRFSDIPAAARSLALIVEDPDAPAGNWVHWLVWNIPPSILEVQENSLPAGAVQGTTSAGTIGYHGPCPPSGTHRYYFRLYALNWLLDLREGAGAGEFKKAAAGHIVAQADLMALYSKN